ncbi:MAG: hypothetical protein JAZ19_18895 [Candidatus Thiodiazotropha taylori]|nr:hypothetical protein [Candidatus Thiodiazotropha taylori]
MQNMQRYFGFKVMVSDFLEPTDYQLIRNKLSELIDCGKIDVEKYKIYLHQLVLAASTTHFGVSGGIEKRVSNIFLKFCINQKQRRRGDIQFVNHIFSKELREDNRHFYLPYEIGYTIPPNFFAEREWFQNVLVTLVRTGLREDYKKIKVKVSAEPAEGYLESIYRKEKANSETRLDLKFNKVVEFNRQTRLFIDHQSNANPEERHMKDPKEPTSTTINVSGGSVTGLNVNSPGAIQLNTTTISGNEEILRHFLQELRTLLTDEVASAPEKDIGVIEGVIAEAPKNPQAIERLKTTGKWFGKSAEKIGLSLLTSYLKGELNL